MSRADEERIEKTKTIKPLDITSHCISKLSGGLIQELTHPPAVPGKRV